MDQLWLWIGFNAFVLVILAFDLGVLNREAHVVSVKEAGAVTAGIVTLAMGFAAAIFFRLIPVEGFGGRDDALLFVTGYLIEFALSVDNIFVIILIFSYFRVPPKYQHRVLFWGILGALVMRGTMIGAGVYLIDRFHWIVYLFGAFLVFTGVRMAFQEEEDIEPEANPVLKLLRRHIRVTSRYHGKNFFIREEARWVATPLFVVLVVVETTDLVFAVDSIPAIFAVTTDPLLVYTSNVFAVLGLRALFFLLAGIIDKFHYLKLGLAAVLVFVGIKMLITYFDAHIPIGVSLAVVVGVLAVSVLASVIFPQAAVEHTPVSRDPLDEPGGASKAERRSRR
ncbi:MAG: TerC family protein [Longimicrobiaceae bacterium]